MRDYDKLIKVLKTMAEKSRGLSMLTGINGDGLPVLFDDAADAIEELVAAVPKWISVEERLPDVAEKVITYNGNFVSENWLCTVADKDGKREIWAYSEGFVTHWMPLPSVEGLNDA